MNANNLTPEEVFLGRLYAWIHQRAEYLRQRNVINQSQLNDLAPQTTEDKPVRKLEQIEDGLQ